MNGVLRLMCRCGCGMCQAACAWPRTAFRSRSPAWPSTATGSISSWLWPLATRCGLFCVAGQSCVGVMRA